MINTNTTISKSIENNQYKYFLKVMKIQIVLMVKGSGVTPTGAKGL